MGPAVLHRLAEVGGLKGKLALTPFNLKRYQPAAKFLSLQLRDPIVEGVLQLSLIVR